MMEHHGTRQRPPPRRRTRPRRAARLLRGRDDRALRVSPPMRARKLPSASALRRATRPEDARASTRQLAYDLAVERATVHLLGEALRAMLRASAVSRPCDPGNLGLCRAAEEQAREALTYTEPN